MDTTTIFVLTSCFFGAGLVYVFLAVRHHGESQLFVDKVQAAEVQAAATKKLLLGYTCYVDHLEACKKAMGDQIKSPMAKVVREYVHTEKLAKDQHKLKSDATVVATYKVEFAFGMDLSAAALEVVDAANGIGLKMPRPSLLGEPVAKLQSHQIVCATDVPEPQAIVAEVNAKFAVLARRYGSAMATEEALRAQCKLKVLETYRDLMAKQNGVRHVPAIFADFK
jgi:hypothetical protein